jgi:hypothetical protein
MIQWPTNKEAQAGHSRWREYLNHFPVALLGYLSPFDHDGLKYITPRNMKDAPGSGAS